MGNTHWTESTRICPRPFTEPVATNDYQTKTLHNPPTDSPDAVHCERPQDDGPGGPDGPDGECNFRLPPIIHPAVTSLQAVSTVFAAKQRRWAMAVWVWVCGGTLSRLCPRPVYPCQLEEGLDWCKLIQLLHVPSISSSQAPAKVIILFSHRLSTDHTLTPRPRPRQLSPWQQKSQYSPKYLPLITTLYLLPPSFPQPS